MKETKKKEEEGVGGSLRREFMGVEDQGLSPRDVLSAQYLRLYSSHPDQSDQSFLMELNNIPDSHDDGEYQLQIQEISNQSVSLYQEMPWCYHYFTDHSSYQFQKAFRVFSGDDLVFEGMLIIDRRIEQFATALFDPDLKHPGFFLLPRSNIQRACAFVRRVLYRISILKQQHQLHVESVKRELFQKQAGGYNSSYDYLDSSLYQEMQQVHRHQQQLLEYQQQQQMHQQGQYLLQQQSDFHPVRQMIYEQQQRHYPERGIQYQDVLRQGNMSEEQLAYAARGFSESGGFDAQIMEAIITQQQQQASRRAAAVGSGYGGAGGGGSYTQYPSYESQPTSSWVSSPVVIPSVPCTQQSGCGTQGCVQTPQGQASQQPPILDYSYQEITQQYGFASASQNPRGGDTTFSGGVREPSFPDVAPKTPPLQHAAEEEEKDCELVGRSAKDMSIGEDMLKSIEIPTNSDVARLQAGPSGLPFTIFDSMGLNNAAAAIQNGGDKDRTDGEDTTGVNEANRQTMEKISADLNKILTTSRSQNMSFELNFGSANSDCERDMSIELMNNTFSYDDVNRILTTENRQ
eukprot:TRINITY_DN6072_c2_g1_i3.p1 TRINITY_DN6072_c2_g1~~TRINITY_DN6072_c2_g1_i3.p1  ORF type:complete len:574 (-),score=105.14 TRINITY_DN6072_c2_g1_i3:925-2646(-)